MSTLLDMAQRFDAADYLAWSRWQGTAWTLADVLIVFVLLRGGDLARRLTGARPHFWSYLIWAATLAGGALIPFMETGAAFFRLEVAVTVPHFLLILYVLAADGPRGLEAVRRIASALHAGEGDALDELPLGDEEEDDNGQGH